ncbi:MAG: hypothetical protein IJ584_13695 [Bacteroidales bacterium]|nr:hypothetical protein [Bacteroidales bacterium]
MTEQQYRRACEIKDRLEALADTKKRIGNTQENRLYFATKYSDEYRCCPDWAMRPIAELLDKHDRMIRQEIEEEIERLKKEIEEL